MILVEMRLSKTNQFQKGRKVFAKLKIMIELLLTGKPLPTRSHDHELGGNWSGHRDCHLEPAWSLIYKLMDGELRLERTGSHSDLF
ncbi:type II toxin-antitoxin system mRNA interferase toxin, RelE/StbE family [soil metagenome]